MWVSIYAIVGHVVRRAEIEDAIHDLTDIVIAQQNEIRQLKKRVAHLERYAKMRRPTMMEGLSDTFSNALGSALGL